MNNSSNWFLDGGTPLGDGSENFRFGQMPAGGTSVYLPEMFDEGDNPIPVAVANLSFSNIAGDGSYNFSFSGDSNETSGLFLYGNVDMDSGGTVTIGNDMALLLDSTSHTVTVGNGASLIVNAPIFDYGDTEAGTASISKEGAGTLVLNSSYSDFSGGVKVHAGTLKLGASSSGSAGSPSSGPVGTGTLKLDAGTTLGLADSDSYDLANNIGLCFTGTVTIDTGAGDLSLLGTISGSSSLDKHGTGSLTLAGANTFTGDVSVHEGTLVLGHDSDYDEGLYSSPVGLGTLKLYDGSTLSMYDEYGYTLINDIALDSSGGTVTIDVPHYSDLTLGSYISGAAGLSKTGDGSLTLTNGDNDFSGGVSVHGGELYLAASSQTGDGMIVSGPVGTGTLKLYDGTMLGVDTGSPITLHNNIDLDCRSSATVEVYTASSNTLTLNGVISGAAELNKTGTGTLNLNGDNTFTGDFYVSGGTVNVGTNTGTGMGALEFGTAPSTLNFLSAAPVVHGLFSDSTNQTIALASGSVFTINQGDTEESYTFQGSIGSTTASVVKEGAGTQIFSGANHYSGGTVINGGVLVANHGDSETHIVDALGSGPITINGGKLQIGANLNLGNSLTLTSGTLGGNYTFNTPQTFGTGVTLSPGNSPGTMTFAAGWAPVGTPTTNFEFNAWSDLPGTNSDRIVVSGGAFDLSGVSAGGYTLKLISLSLVGGNTAGAIDGTAVATTWTIFQTGTVLSASDLLKFNIDSTDFVGGGTFSLALAGSNQNIQLNFTPVPEPATYALMALGLAGSSFAAWRKRRRAG